MENEAAERETERKLAKAKAKVVDQEEETEEEEEEEEEEELVRCESMENLTKQVKRELELSDRLDKSLLRSHSQFLEIIPFSICFISHLYSFLLFSFLNYQHLCPNPHFDLCTANATTRVPALAIRWLLTMGWKSSASKLLRGYLLAFKTVINMQMMIIVMMMVMIMVMKLLNMIVMVGYRLEELNLQVVEKYHNDDPGNNKYNIDNHDLRSAVQWATSSSKSGLGQDRDNYKVTYCRCSFHLL